MKKQRAISPFTKSWERSRTAHPQIETREQWEKPAEPKWYDCTCYVDCAEDPRTACSHSGEEHQHEDEPCPVHFGERVVG